MLASKKWLLLLGSVAILGCAAKESSQSTGNAAADARAQQANPAASPRKEVPAPIESVDVRESAPPQYALHIVSGLPSGCAQFSRIEVARRDDVVDVKVWNTVPTDESTVCTMIYGTAENNANLGSEFESGKTYRVYVNSEPKATFRGQ